VNRDSTSSLGEGWCIRTPSPRTVRWCVGHGFLRTVQCHCVHASGSKHAHNLSPQTSSTSTWQIIRCKHYMSQRGGRDHDVTYEFLSANHIHQADRRLVTMNHNRVKAMKPKQAQGSNSMPGTKHANAKGHRAVCQRVEEGSAKAATLASQSFPEAGRDSRRRPLTSEYGLGVWCCAPDKTDSITASAPSTFKRVHGNYYI